MIQNIFRSLNSNGFFIATVPSNDNLYPSRIIIGSECENGKAFANLLIGAAEKEDIDMLFIPQTEAEAIKLFANT